MKFKSYEEAAFIAFKNGNRMAAVNLLRRGAPLAEYTYQAQRLKDYALALEEYLRGFDYQEGDTSFAEIYLRWCLEGRVIA